MTATSFSDLPRAARPGDLDPLDGLRRAQADVQADVVAAQIAGDVVDLPDLHAGRRSAPARSRRGRSVALRALARECVIQLPPPARLVLQQHRRSSDARDDDVELAVVVEVGDRQPAADAVGLERRPALRETSRNRAADVLVQQVLLRVRAGWADRA